MLSLLLSYLLPVPATDLSMAPAHTPYIGRFAPSPTGPLHLGSLFVALASFLQARHSGGQWLVRIEDLDQPRVRTGAAAGILETLESHGMHWDGPVLYQSTRSEAYAEALVRLERRQLVYPCICTRRELAELPPGIDGPVYPGTCRHSPPLRPERFAVRLRAPAGTIHCTDDVQGYYEQDIAGEVGDFVLKRTDGLFAYQLAVVVDDAWQGITEVVRGADLLSSTPRQIHLQSLLDYPHPRYLHMPLLVNADGSKLSKQNHADPVTGLRPERVLLLCLGLLGQSPAIELTDANPEEILHWGIHHWNLSRVPGLQKLPVTAMA